MSGHILPETPAPTTVKVCEYCESDLVNGKCWCEESGDGRMLRKVLDRLKELDFKLAFVSQNKQQTKETKMRCRVNLRTSPFTFEILQANDFEANGLAGIGNGAVVEVVITEVLGAQSQAPLETAESPLVNPPVNTDGHITPSNPPASPPPDAKNVTTIPLTS